MAKTTFTQSELNNIIGGSVNTGAVRTVSKPQTPTTQYTTSETERTNMFQPEKPTSFLGRARDFAVNIFGGEKLAEGLGQSIAAPEIQANFEQIQQQNFQTQADILKRLREKKANGEDTTNLEKALKANQEAIKELNQYNQDFVDSLVTNKEVLASSARLATTAVTGNLFRGAEKLTGVANATTRTGQVFRTASAGSIAGSVEGAIQMGGSEAERGGDTRDIITGSIIGGVGGGVLGGLTAGLVGGWKTWRGPKTLKQKLNYLTPEAGELSATQYKHLLGRSIKPKTATEPAQFIFSERQANIANKYADILTTNAEETAINIVNKVDDLDRQVGVFLRKRNSIFNTGELRNTLSRGMDDIINITVPEEQIARAKSKLIEGFINRLEKNDLVSLWQLRKDFNREIQSAFSGSPSLQKEVKTALRDTVQYFIKERTPRGQYAQYMDDMSSLIDLNENVVMLKASKERGRSVLGQWIKKNPQKAKWITIGGGWLIANQFIDLNPFD